jgi:hypothetical protein
MRAAAAAWKHFNSLAERVIDLLAGLFHGTFRIDRVLNVFDDLVHFLANLLGRALLLARAEAGDEREKAERNQ